ncbi:MAG: hypothetical protein ACYS5V_06560 [Planctomycetota bacterium]|jgi:hypothetical protein
MRKHIVVAGILAGVLICTVALVRAGMEVKPDKENVVASRLVGKWTVHASLSSRLTGRKTPRGESGGRSYEFCADPKVGGSVPAKYGKFLKGKRIYLAGTMKVRRGRGEVKEHPFILTSHRGNPHVVWFRPRQNDPMGDAESFNVMLAVARETAKDLLFVGGDFNNQPFSAFERVAEEQ